MARPDNRRQPRTIAPVRPDTPDVDARRAWYAAKLQFFDSLSTSAELKDLDVRVAWRLLRYHNLAKGYSWPSLETIAGEVHSNRRSVIRAVNRLVALGWFQRESGGGRGHSSRYVPELEKVTRESPFPPHDAETVTQAAENSDSKCPQTVTRESPDSLEETFKKSPAPLPALAPLDGASPAGAKARQEGIGDAWRELEAWLLAKTRSNWDAVMSLAGDWERLAAEYLACPDDDDREQFRLRLFVAISGGRADEASRPADIEPAAEGKPTARGVA